MISASRQAKIVELVEVSPGIRFNEIMRKTGLKNGVLSHHLRKLEKNGRIRVERTTRSTRCYLHNINGIESIILKRLRQDTSRKILLAMLSEDQITFSRITKCVERSASTTSMNLTQLIEDGLVEYKIVNLKRIYMIKNSKLVYELITRYQPTLIERAVSGMEDVFSSL